MQVTEPSYILVRFRDAPETARAQRRLDGAWVDLPVGFLLVNSDPNPTVRCQLAITLTGSHNGTAAELPTLVGGAPVGTRRAGHTARGGRGGARGARNGARGGGRMASSAGAAPSTAGAVMGAAPSTAGAVMGAAPVLATD